MAESRSGVDVFKALALGADAVIIARPFVTAVYGGAEEGVKPHTDRRLEQSWKRHDENVRGNESQRDRPERLSGSK